MTISARTLPLLAIVSAAGMVFACGCGSGPPLQRAKGQVLVDGKNYQVGPREQLQVIFFPDVETPTNTYPAEVKPDGSFETLGREGQGIPPGMYRVSISSPFGGGSVAIPNELSTAKSPIIREIVLGKDSLDPIDIFKPAG